MADAVGVLVGALLLDAIDSKLPIDERQAAAVRAVEVSPAYAVAFLVAVIGEAHEALALATGMPAADVAKLIRLRLRQNSRVVQPNERG